jgi:hypothetical protein
MELIKAPKGFMVSVSTMIVALLAVSPSAVNAVEVDVTDNGTSYGTWDITLVGDNDACWADLEYLLGDLTQQEWWSNDALALTFAESTGGAAGWPNDLGYLEGPYFVSEITFSGGSAISYTFAYCTQSTGVCSLASNTGGCGDKFIAVATEVSQVQTVTIDIKPGSFPNSINLCSHGVIPAAVFSSADFDVTDIETETLRLGDAAVKMVGKSGRELCNYEDVNQDGLTDLVCKFETLGLDLSGGETSASVVGETLFGVQIAGEDSVNIVKDGCP